MMRRILAILVACTVSLPIAAFAQGIDPAGSPITGLWTNPTLSNGGTTQNVEDTFTNCSFNMQAKSLANVGDVLAVFAGGTARPTADNKVFRLRVGGLQAVTEAATTVSGTKWSFYSETMKAGDNSQITNAIGNVTNSTGPATGPTATAANTDTALTVSVTVINTTATDATPNTCNYMRAWVIRASNS